MSSKPPLPTRASKDVAALILTSLLLTFVLGACSTPPSTPAGPTLDLQGLWLVVPSPTTTYGAGGTTTLEFGPGDSGSATYVSKANSNAITTCRQDLYAVLSNKVMLLDDLFYEIASATADTIDLVRGSDAITLSRVSGTSPVKGCLTATAQQVAAYPSPPSSWSNLNAVADTLYLNLDDTGDPIIGFDTVTKSFGPPRTYSDSVAGGVHRYVVAARSDDLFYGQCACGGSQEVDYFDLGTNTSVTYYDTASDPSAEISVRYGYYQGVSLVIGGRSRADGSENLLLTLDRDTLALLSSRSVLPEGTITDVTLYQGKLLALTRVGLVEVGTDGMAEQTYTLPATTGDLNQRRGITSVGDQLYLLGQDAGGRTLIFELALPGA